MAEINQRRDDDDAPFVALVCYEAESESRYELRSPVVVRASNIDAAIQQLKPKIILTVESSMLASLLDGRFSVLDFVYPIDSVNDFLPHYLVAKEPHLSELNQLVSDIHFALQQADPLAEMSQTHYQLLRVNHEIEALNTVLELERFKIRIENLLNDVVNDIIHQANWQRMEALWRSLLTLLDQASTQGHVDIELLPYHPEFLWDDLTASDDLTDSDTYHRLYQHRIGQFGLAPYSVIVLDCEFGIKGHQVKLMRQFARLGQLIQAPIVANTNVSLLSCDCYQNLMPPDDLIETFQTVKYIKFREVMASDAAQYLVLTLPRIKLRKTYQAKTLKLSWFKERNRRIQAESSLFGPASFAYVGNLIKSFQQTGLCYRATGMHYGGITLPFSSMGTNELPTEVMFSEPMESALIGLGLNPVCTNKADNTLYFRSDNSLYWGNLLINRFQHQINPLEGKLSVLMLILRIAQRLKSRIQDETGSEQSLSALNQNAKVWLAQFVSSAERPSIESITLRPLKRAHIDIAVHETDPSYYAFELSLTPHLIDLDNDIPVDVQFNLERAADARESR